MLRANFFMKFFKCEQNSKREIVKYNSNKKFALQDQIKNKILEIDQKISENSKSLIEAQIVKFKSTIAKSSNLIEKIGHNVYKKKIEESIDWHQKQLKELYFQRKDLQIHLEKIKGIYWLNQLKRILAIILIGFLTLLILIIFFSGFMIIVYLLPMIILIYIGYLLSTKKY